MEDFTFEKHGTAVVSDYGHPSNFRRLILFISNAVIDVNFGRDYVQVYVPYFEPYLKKSSASEFRPKIVIREL